MTVRTRLDPIERDIQLFFEQALSPTARSKTLAQFARDQRDEAKETNRRVLGRVPAFETIVDGSAGASEDQVRPDGRIVYEFQLGSEVLLFIRAELQKVSPRRSGRYANSNEEFADGTRVDNQAKTPTMAQEYTFMNSRLYARKIEGAGGKPPSSRQAPDGVYEVVATRARARFGNSARISFGYRTVIGGALVGGHRGNRADQRNPAIIVTLR